MVQQVKVLATQPWRPEFNPWNSPWKGRLKPTRLSSDLHMCTHIMHTHMHVRIHTLIINIFKLLSQGCQASSLERVRTYYTQTYRAQWPLGRLSPERGLGKTRIQLSSDLNLRAQQANTEVQRRLLCPLLSHGICRSPTSYECPLLALVTRSFPKAPLQSFLRK